ncbi:hypothetical protein [Oceanibium sediminis]|uniref:hypothetical protein n=1 Tax=Oceanibium sediminis TaxID=2026339 RepID=UPI000DD49B13|nr:hypothetical protein [Oceanibium sediminis]
MFRTMTSLVVIGLLAGCVDGPRPPAGGYGPFDPPPPAPFDQPEAISTLPGVPGSAGVTVRDPAGTQVATTDQQPQDADPNAALARDVTAVLGGTPRTGSGSTSAPATGSSAGAVPGATEIGIDPNDDSINLNLTSQEQQKRERDAAQARREAAQQQLVVVAPEPVPEQNINANVVAFAKETTHPVGTKRYNRPAFRNRVQSASNCRRLGSDDEAQRQFLANGGPTTDRFNLDPDGDGFACDFDPEKYRKLNF